MHKINNKGHISISYYQSYLNIIIFKEAALESFLGRQLPIEKCSENLCGLINHSSFAAGGRATNPRQVSGEGGRVEGAVQQEFKSLRVYSSGAVQQGPPGRLLPCQVLGRPQHAQHL